LAVYPEVTANRRQVIPVPGLCGRNPTVLSELFARVGVKDVNSPVHFIELTLQVVLRSDQKPESDTMTPNA
jgi:hypothetical protein